MFFVEWVCWCYLCDEDFFDVVVEFEFVVCFLVQVLELQFELFYGVRFVRFCDFGDFIDGFVFFQEYGFFDFDLVVLDFDVNFVVGCFV